jgi:hypothetical protein
MLLFIFMQLLSELLIYRTRKSEWVWIPLGFGESTSFKSLSCRLAFHQHCE